MLGKENTKEQVIDNQSRLIRMQKEDTLLSSSQQILKLPEGFTIGKAIGGGDCFFDAVAQGLRQLRPGMEFTVKSLRQVCKKLTLNDQQLRKQVIQDARKLEGYGVILPQPGINDDELWSAYLDSIEYTVEDIEKMKSTNLPLHQALTGSKYGSTLQAPIWGRVEIEGRLICKKYNVKLHVIESNPWYTNDNQQEPFLHQLIDDSGLRNIGGYDKVDYNDGSILHIINGGYSHFEPILRKEVQQPLPYSDLTQVQSMLKELSLEQIYEELINTIEDCSLLEMEKLEKLKVFFRAHPRLDVNCQVNQRGDTLLHIAVCNDELEIIRFLLRKRANANILNMEGKTSIDIARSNNRKGIAKILQPLVSYKRIDVPGDGSCLFWSVALAYLTPVKFDNNKFCKRFYQLFGDGHDVQTIQRLIQGDVHICQNDMLRWLVEKIFRERVVEKMRSFQEELKDEISMIDFFESKNEGYITNGSFKEKFLSDFGSEIEVKQQYGIESSKLQPSHFNSNAVDDICIELEKIHNPKKVRKFQFEAYLECMRSPKAWGGTYEIKAMSQLLETAITVCKENSSETYGKQRECHNNEIRLFYKNRNHCQFYQTEYSDLVKFVQSFVQSFEMKLIIYSTFGEMIRRKKEVLPQEVINKDFVRSIFGFSVCRGVRTIGGERAYRSRSFSCLSDLIEMFDSCKLIFRKVLVDAGCDIFQSFEAQLEKIGFDQVSSVVEDIVDKIIQYYIQKEYDRSVDGASIVEALVLDKYSQKIHGKVAQYGKRSYNIIDLYENIGIVTGKEDSLIYYEKRDKSSQYGYRRLFICEKLRKVYDAVKTTSTEFEDYVYTLDQQSFVNTVEEVFSIVNEEIQIPSRGKWNNLVEQVRSHIEKEAESLFKEIKFLHRKRKTSLLCRQESLITAEKRKPISARDTAASIKRLKKSEKNLEYMSLVKDSLVKLQDLAYYSKLEKIFKNHTEEIFQEYKKSFELHYNDTKKTDGFQLSIKGINQSFFSIKRFKSKLKKQKLKDVCPAVDDFTGRQEQVKRICQELQKEKGAVVVITGKYGMGKTQLARKCAEESRESYSHIYEIEDSNMLPIERRFSSLTKRKLGIYMEEKKSLIGSKKCLIICHNAKREDIEEVLEVEDRVGFDFLFTFPDQPCKGVVEVALDAFEEDQAVQLTKRILGIVDKSQDEQIKVFVKRLEGFPLAIKLAAAYIRNSKLSNSKEAFGIHEYLIKYEDLDQVIPKNNKQDKYDRVLLVTTGISMEVMEKKNGGVPFRCLKVMAHLGNSYIDPDMFLVLVELESTFKLMENYSLLDIEMIGRKKMYVIHESIKEAIRSQIAEDQKEDILLTAVEIFEDEFSNLLEKTDTLHLIALVDYLGNYNTFKEEEPFVIRSITRLHLEGEYKEVVRLSTRILPIIESSTENSLKIRYLRALALVALEDCSGLKELFELRKSSYRGYFEQMLLDHFIVITYTIEEKYDCALDYLRSCASLLSVSDNLSSRLATLSIDLARVFVMKEEYLCAFTVLYYVEHFKVEFNSTGKDNFYQDFFKNHDLLYFSYLKYTRTLGKLYSIQDEKYFYLTTTSPHINLHKLNSSILQECLFDILKYQKQSPFILRSPFIEKMISIKDKRNLLDEVLTEFNNLISSGELYESNHIGFYKNLIQLSVGYAYLGKKGASQELKNMQELQERRIGLNHLGTTQKMSTESERKKCLEKEIEKKSFLPQSKVIDFAVGNTLYEDSVNLYCRNSISFLHYVVTASSDIIEYLTDKWANMNLKFSSLLNIIPSLLERGACINLQDKRGRGVLHYAVIAGHLNIVKYFVEKGANVNLQDRNGVSPLQYAVIAGRLDIIEYLLEQGATMNLEYKDLLRYCIAIHDQNVKAQSIMSSGPCSSDLKVQSHRKQQKTTIHLGKSKKRRLENTSAISKENTPNIQLLQDNVSDTSMQFEDLDHRMQGDICNKLEEKVNSQLENSDSQQLVDNRYWCMQ
ncbi:ankyrin repeat domain-containing protein [Wolbachia endosymbiont (group B) of Anania hortulata]|uniref:ankyrin repeat domain-containing protein n=1 Tax=Wolbachia endosymbiont (group B) of Anania hortulata TaxID=3139312 RepID=UPI003CCB5842